MCSAVFTRKLFCQRIYLNPARRLAIVALCARPKPSDAHVVEAVRQRDEYPLHVVVDVGFRSAGIAQDPRHQADIVVDQRAQAYLTLALAQHLTKYSGRPEGWQGNRRAKREGGGVGHGLTRHDGLIVPLYSRQPASGSHRARTYKP